MAALTADTTRKYSDGPLNDLLVKASSTIYRGDVIGLVSGYARQLVAGDLFGGFATAKATGTASDGGVFVNALIEGEVELSISAAAVTDIGKAVFASDSNTFTFTAGSNTRIGAVARWVATGTVIVAFDGSRSSSMSSVVALTDSSGGAAANNTIGLVTAPTAITDNTTGATTATFAAGFGVTTLTFPFTFITSTSAIDVVTNHTLGYKFKVLSWAWVDGGTALVGGSGSRVANMEIGSVDVGTSASTCTVVQASTAQGRRISGTTVTGANTGSASDTFSIEIATGGTDITAGNGSFYVTVQNMDTADAVAGICTAQTANRTAIVALTDAITEVATKTNEIINNLE